MNEHEIEPVPGLPADLPAGEKILWQGAPRARSLAIHGFCLRMLAGYFAVLLIWSVVGAFSPGASLTSTGFSILRIAGFSVVGLGFVALFAHLVEKTTIYTITNRRVVMRFGVTLPMTINIPFGTIEEAALKRNPDGSGDIALTLSGKQAIAYLVLWPHVRPWQLRRSTPALRAVPNAAGIAELLGHALSGTLTGGEFAPVSASRDRPVNASVEPFHPSTAAA
jgi:hypothetical protein